MIDHAAAGFVEFLCKNGRIQPDEREFYLFGFRQAGRMAVNVLTTIAIGLSLGMWWQSMVFLLGFIPVRSYVGGYHAKTPLRCYLISIIMITVALLWVKNAGSLRWIPVIMAVCSLVIIYYYSPVENSKKRLTSKEQEVFARRAKRNSCIITMGILISWFLCREFALCLVASIISAALLAVIGMMENRILKSTKI